MFKVICIETCQGDNNFVFKKDNCYNCIEEKDIVVIIEDDDGNKNTFYKNEYKDLFKPL